MGAVFEVPLVRIGDPPDLDQLPGTTVALVADDGVPLAQVELAGPVTLLVGSERDGLPRGGRERRRHGRADPDREPLAERRDGRDRRAL